MSDFGGEKDQVPLTLLLFVSNVANEFKIYQQDVFLKY